MQRMGKSTLVYNALIRKKDELYEKGILVTSHTLSTYNNDVEFFKSIVDEVYDLLLEDKDIIDKIEPIWRTVVSSDSASNPNIHIKRFFNKLLSLGKRVVCIIDEFDHSPDIFPTNSGFSFLRDLSYQPATSVTFVFISRRRIPELEYRSNSSTLFNIVGSPIYVTNYSNEDLDKYFNRNEKYGIKITNDQKKQVLAITGAQPYWLDILFQEYEKQERRVDDFSILFQDNRAVFYQLYKGLLDLLKDQDLLDKLYQILFGPCMDYTIEDVQKLLDYGIISRTQTSIELMSENLLNS